MKDHVAVQMNVTSYGETLPELIEQLSKINDELIHPTCTVWQGEIEIRGWRPMNDRELAKAKRDRERARERRKKQAMVKEAKERAEYDRLRAKFESS